MYQSTEACHHIVVTTLSIVCFINSLHNGLVHDDVFAIEKNGDIRPETPIENIFQNDFWGRELTSPKSHKSYRPLCTLTFRLNYMVHGLDPFGYHLVNLILHILVSNYFMFILKLLIFKDEIQSFMAALLFSVHPVHVEAVTGVVGRADVLSCFLFLITFHFYVRLMESMKDGGDLLSNNLSGILLFGTATLFVKEHSVMIFPVCMTYDVFKNKKEILSKLIPSYTKDSNDDDKMKKKDFVGLLKRASFLLFWLTQLFQLRLHMMDYTLPIFKEEDNQASFSKQLSTRVLTYLYLIAFNIEILLSPSTLCYDWQIGSIPLVESLADSRNLEMLLCMLIFIVIVGKILIAILKNKDAEHNEVVVIGLLFLVIPFLPASNFFIRVGFTVAERILYIPSLGFSILVTVGFHRLKMRFPNMQRILSIMFGVLVVLFCLKTISYNRVWYSRETLFKSGVQTLPHNAKVHYNYANFLRDHNKTRQAIHHYQQAVRLYPVHSSAHNNLGTLLVNENQLKEAEYHFKEAIRNTPGHYNAMLNLGDLYSKQQNFVDAELMLRKSLSLKPDLFDSRLLLAYVLSKQESKKNEALELYEKLASSYKDNDVVLHNYAVFLKQNGQVDRAVSLLTSLLSKDPKDFLYLTSLANIYKENNNPRMAKQLFERAISYHPHKTSLYQNVAVFHFNRGEWNEAQDAYERMAKIGRPTNEYKRNHAVVLFQLKKHDEAFEMLESILTKNPNDLNAHYTMVNFVVDLGQIEKANTFINNALIKFPDDINLLVQKANLKIKENSYDEAIKLYQRVLLKDPNNFDANLNMGTVFHLMKNYKEAEKYYARAQQTNPSHSTVAENMKKLKRIMNKQKQM